jgi:hypothetical protein
VFHERQTADTDEENWTNPRRVEVYARSDELAAEVLEKLAGRAATYRENARRIREARTTNVPSPFLEEAYTT